MNPEPSELQQAGHIFGLPTLPLPSTSHIKHRYDPIVDQVTKLMMKDGKLSKAQRVRPSVLLYFISHSAYIVILNGGANNGHRIWP